MKQLVIAIALVVLGIGMVAVGIFASGSIFIAASALFCVLPFSLIFLGWSLHAAGIRVSVGTGIQAQPVQPATSRRRSMSNGSSLLNRMKAGETNNVEWE